MERTKRDDRPPSMVPWAIGGPLVGLAVVVAFSGELGPWLLPGAFVICSNLAILAILRRREGRSVAKYRSKALRLGILDTPARAAALLAAFACVAGLSQLLLGAEGVGMTVLGLAALMAAAAIYLAVVTPRR